MNFTNILEKFIVYRFFRKCYRKHIWKKNNSDNNIILKELFNYNKVIAGKHSYGTIDLLMHSKEPHKLYIGNFCSIAPNVLFIIASDHNYKCLSTFPFKVMVAGEKAEALSKGDIIVKDDVWIGANSTILSGVTINQGAIVAAGSVVTKDVPPYAIVGGNPAKVIKYRFSEPIIQKLLKIDYSKLSDETILNNLDTMYEEITEENVNNIVNKLIKNTKTVEVTGAF